ncbi:MAG: AbrB/MazE/SpoVT family DNA-binding domain-containing protein [Candidatus Aminicenantes bacterium]|nr:MAG: AbrB/MazE/SpoVT family DNA-binding domain-containing protein [Candidatus Aminicenantes bacterium]
MQSLSVTVSPEFQVVIPRTIRKSLHLQAGQKMQVFLYNNRIEMIPVRPIKEARGFLKGIDTSVAREQDKTKSKSTSNKEFDKFISGSIEVEEIVIPSREEIYERR